MALDGGDNGPFGFITDPSAVLCGYGCLPAPPGMTFRLTEIMWDPRRFPYCASECGFEFDFWIFFLKGSPVSRFVGPDLCGIKCDLQGTQLRHVVEAGNRDAADVVVVQRSVEEKKRKGKEQTKALSLAR